MKIALGLVLLAAITAGSLFCIAYGMHGLSEAITGSYKQHTAFAWFYFCTVLLGALMGLAIVYAKLRYVIRNRKW